MALRSISKVRPLRANARFWLHHRLRYSKRAEIDDERALFKPQAEKKDKEEEGSRKSPEAKEATLIWDETFAQCDLWMKEPGAIRKLMSVWNYSMVISWSALTGIFYFFPVPYLCSPELVVATAATRFSRRLMYGSIETRAKIIIKRHPKLAKLKFSRALPDPDRQDLREMQEALKEEYGMFKNVDHSKFEAQLNFREQGLEGQKKYGFAWDIADNVRSVAMIPGFTFGFTLGHLSQGIYEWGLYYPPLFNLAMPACASIFLLRLASPLYFRGALNSLESILAREKTVKEYWREKKS